MVDTAIALGVLWGFEHIFVFWNEAGGSSAVANNLRAKNRGLKEKDDSHAAKIRNSTTVLLSGLPRLYDVMRPIRAPSFPHLVPYVSFLTFL